MGLVMGQTTKALTSLLSQKLGSLLGSVTVKHLRRSTPFRSDRLARKGGGIILYVKNTLTVKAVETVAHESETCEMLRCRLKCKGQDVNVIVICRSPECEAADFLLSKLTLWTDK
ncbi:unnamed protein product [Heterobilharzia americana]|nr:unnamed protein product [Heterobilharzia americana]CAH8636431.1 unnamed protein product [Heterobilharzia americana]